MKLNNVLVVFKHRVSNVSGKTGGRSFAERLKDRQTQHEAVTVIVSKELKKRQIGFELVDRDTLKTGLHGDLIVAIGGDGTFLAASHFAGNIPVLGLNSMPGYSVGFFCAATAETFGKTMDGILSGKFRERSLPLIEARIDSKALPLAAVNDILFAAASPAETARYVLEIGRSSEGQKTSGVWIAAGPGSTAAIHAAGGRSTPIDSAQLQYLVREPCNLPGQTYKLTRGLLQEGSSISIISEMADGMVFIDGPKLSWPLPPGSKLTASIARQRLRVFV